MHLHTMRIANAVIGVSLLALLAVALIAGQARDRLPYESLAATATERQLNHSLVLTRARLSKLEQLPNVVDTLLALPLTMEIGVDGVTIRPERLGSPTRRTD